MGPLAVWRCAWLAGWQARRVRNRFSAVKKTLRQTVLLRRMPLLHVQVQPPPKIFGQPSSCLSLPNNNTTTQPHNHTTTSIFLLRAYPDLHLLHFPIQSPDLESWPPARRWTLSRLSSSSSRWITLSSTTSTGKHLQGFRLIACNPWV